MKYSFLILAFCYLIQSAISEDRVHLSKGYGSLVTEKLKPYFSPSLAQIEALLQGEVISTGKVHSPSDKEQQLNLFVSGIHPRNCTRAMRKLSLYENYHQYIDFIKTSQYDDHHEKFFFTIDHTLLPFRAYPTSYQSFKARENGRVAHQKIKSFCVARDIYDDP